MKAYINHSTLHSTEEHESNTFINSAKPYRTFWQSLVTTLIVFVFENETLQCTGINQTYGI